MVEDWKTILGAGGLVGLGTGLVIDKSTKPKEETVQLKDTSVEIHTLTYNEEETIEKSLKSILEQPLYKRNRNVRSVLVDSQSTDNTIEIASEYVDDIWRTPKGKVTSRDEAYRRSNADIIVHTDADIERPEYWLSNLLKPFSNPDTVATHGPSLTKDPIYKAPKGLWVPLDYKIPKLIGQNVAIRRQAYTNSKGFNTNIDETKFHEVQKAEEYGLYNLMDGQGEIVWVWNAPVYSSSRRRLLSIEKIRQTKEAKKHKELREAGKRF